VGTFTRLAAAVPVLLGLLNALGGTIAAVWLAILGEWEIILKGLAAYAAALFGLRLALAPGWRLGTAAARLYGKGNKLGFYLFFFLNGLYAAAILTVWCMGVLQFFAREADTSSIIPVLVWSYSVATDPIRRIAREDVQGGSGHGLEFLAFFAQVAYVLVMLAALFFSVSIVDATILFGAVMTIGVVFIVVVVGVIFGAGVSQG